MVGIGTSVEFGGLRAAHSAGHLEPKFYTQVCGIVQFSAGGVCLILRHKVLF